MPEAYAGGGGASGISGVCRGRQRGPGPISPNGALAPAQPIAFASSRTARRYFRISSARAHGKSHIRYGLRRAIHLGERNAEFLVVGFCAITQVAERDSLAQLY